MSDLRTKMVIDLTGNLERNAKRYSGAIDNFSRRGSQSMAILGRGVREVSNGLDRIGNRYTAFLTGAAGVGTVRMLFNLEDRFTRLGIQANASAEDIDHLKNKIFDAARAPQIKLDPGEITSAIEEIIEKTGDLKFAEQNIKNIGLAISATGAAGKDIGGIMAEFQKMGIIDPKKVLEALDILNVQGKEGAFTLQELANLGPRVVTAYTATGRGGVQAIREMGAALQVIRQGTGSSEQAATAFEALMRTMADAQKVKLLSKNGIKIFDQKEMKAGREVLRPVNELMVEIVKATKGRQTVLSKVFDAEAIRAFNAAASEFKRSGSVGMLDKFMQVHGDGATTIKDSARAAQTANRNLGQLYVAWEQFADNRLSGPIGNLTNLLNSVDQETVDRWLSIGTGLAGALGGLVIANKAVGAGKGIFDLIRRIRGGKGGGGSKSGSGDLSKFGDAIPVYVVNGPASILSNDSNRIPEIVKKGATVTALTAGTAAAAVALSMTATALAAEGSKALGKKMATNEAGMRGIEDLVALRSRQMVMGGGEGSFQVKTIDAELAKRYGGMNAGLPSAGSGAEQLRGEVVIKVQTDPGLKTKTEAPRSNLSDFDLAVEAERGHAMGGSW